MPQGKKFLSTPSARRATQRRRAARRARQISIHALCEEGDSSRSLVCSMLLSFLSTPSARRATHGRRDNLCSGQISIHALCEEGDDHRRPAAHVRQISIHALCEEGDGSSRRMPAASFDFYPRPLRGGRHTALSPPASPMIFLSTPSARRATSSKEDEIMVEWKFLSTPSARRATSGAGGACKGSGYFYPRPLRGGRRPYCKHQKELG